jgi:tetratricopeptide (TPR) repeat protein
LVRDFEDAELYYERAKKGYEEQLGPDSEKALEVTLSLICATVMSEGERIEKLRVLVERMVRALGEENVVTLAALGQLGIQLRQNGEPEEARKVYERCLAGQEKVLGEDHKDTLDTVCNLGVVYDVGLEDYEKALEFYERALKGNEKTLGKTHPDTLGAVVNIASVYQEGLKDYGIAEELYQRALEGYEAQRRAYQGASSPTSSHSPSKLSHRTPTPSHNPPNQHHKLPPNYTPCPTYPYDPPQAPSPAPPNTFHKLFSPPLALHSASAEYQVGRAQPK